MRKTIGFIGGGNMAEAIIRGLRAARAARPKDMLVADVSVARVKALAETFGVVPVASNLELCRRAEVIFLAVKPQVINTVLREIASQLDEQKLVISIAAGVTLFAIESRLQKKARLIRVMPNTPLLVGKGMSAFACGSAVRAEDRKLVRNLFGSVGRVIEVDEKDMDAVTALSGSGPAYVFGFIEGLADGGVKVGLPRDQALLLAAQTVAGAAEMVLATGRHPAELKDQVCSPGGTTIHGWHALEQGGLKGLLMAAVEAGFRRARELGGG